MTPRPRPKTGEGRGLANPLRSEPDTGTSRGGGERMAVVGSNKRTKPIKHQSSGPAGNATRKARRKRRKEQRR